MIYVIVNRTYDSSFEELTAWAIRGLTDLEDVGILEDQNLVTKIGSNYIMISLN